MPLAPVVGLLLNNIFLDLITYPERVGRELSIAVEFAPKYGQEHFFFRPTFSSSWSGPRYLTPQNEKKKKKCEHVLTWLDRAIHGHHEYGLTCAFLQLLLAENGSTRLPQLFIRPKSKKTKFLFFVARQTMLNRRSSARDGDCRSQNVRDVSVAFYRSLFVTLCSYMGFVWAIVGFSSQNNFDGQRKYVAQNIFQCARHMWTPGT